MALVRRTEWGDEIFRLVHCGTEWEWQSGLDPDVGYGPFSSRHEAILFGQRIGDVILLRKGTML